MHQLSSSPELVLMQKQLVTIPKAVNKGHINDDLNALRWNLEKDDLEQPDDIFPIIKVSSGS
jgi:diketogulonate reductase-like aldo/keto reductase